MPASRADNLCVGYTAQGGTPKDHDLTVDGDGDGYGDGGRWFIRERQRFAMLIKMSLETRFLRLLHILFCST